MSRVEEIEAQIATLTDAERAELRDRFLREDADLWDQQIEADSLSGKLDELFAEALHEHAAGKSTPLWTTRLRPSSGRITRLCRATSSFKPTAPFGSSNRTRITPRYS